jgi:hypothetical protein
MPFVAVSGLARTGNVQAPADRPSSFGRQTRIGLGGWSCPPLAGSQSINCDIVVGEKAAYHASLSALRFLVSMTDTTQYR